MLPIEELYSVIDELSILSKGIHSVPWLTHSQGVETALLNRTGDSAVGYSTSAVWAEESKSSFSRL